MWAVFGQHYYENQSETMHVESVDIARLDEGSIPSVSTKNRKQIMFTVFFLELF